MDDRSEQGGEPCQNELVQGGGDHSAGIWRGGNYDGVCLTYSSPSPQGERVIVLDWACGDPLEGGVRSGKLLDRGGIGLPLHAPKFQGR